jgi:UDP-N-acetylglucosamine--N-acetylmuramyl-(pentapeptide) pyrophosphoryl-undecaprenol N-acetylglucosamine transferase
MNQFFPESRITISGNPVRETIVKSSITREEGIGFFHLDPSRKTVLVVGGSLGAKSINEAILAGIKDFEAAGIQLIWQTGKLFKDTAIEAVKSSKGIYTNDFISSMENAYAAADVVISRAGAMSIAELAVVRKPVIFVPYPFAAEDHQTVNASKLVLKGAGILVKDSEAKAILVKTVIELVKNETKQEDMKRNIASTAITNADQIVAAEVLRIIDLDGAIA